MVPPNEIGASAPNRMGRLLGGPDASEASVTSTSNRHSDQPSVSPTGQKASNPVWQAALLDGAVGRG